MNDILKKLDSPLFEGIQPEDRMAMLGCTGYHIGSFRKGDIVAFEGENIKHIGIVISGSPVSSEACANIGADEWAHSPQKTVDTCKSWAE